MVANPLDFLGRGQLAAVEADDMIPVWDKSAANLKRSSVSVIRAAPARTLSVSLTADQNDWSPSGLSDADALFVDADNDYTITGIAAQPDGTRLQIVNVDSFELLTLSSSDSRSSAANRFAFGVLPVLVLEPGAAAELVYRGSESRWRLSLIGITPLVSTRQLIYELWEMDPNSNPYLTVSVSGAGAAVTRAIAGSDIGQAALATGTTTTGRAGVSSLAALLRPNQGIVVKEFGLFLGTALSDGTNRYTVRGGLGDSLTGDGTDGAFFRGVDNVNSGKWEAVCRAASTETVADTGHTIVAVSELFYGAVVIYVARGVADFYTATERGTIAWKARISTNVPGATEAYGYFASSIKSLGTTSRDVSYLAPRLSYYAGS